MTHLKLGQGKPAKSISTLVAVLAASMIFGAAVANAQTYYVSPTGSGTMCTQANPCPIENGTSVSPGSEVVVMPGDYTVSTPLSSLNSADIHGVAGQPRPRIMSTYPGPSPAWQLGNSTNVITFRHIELDSAASVGVATSGNIGTASTTIEDAVVRTTGTGGWACGPGGTGGTTNIIMNSLCQGPTTGLGITCVGCNESVTLRNVTAIGGTNGINFDSGTGSPSTFTVDAFNTIARHTGAGADVAAAARTTNSSSVINLDHSNYASATTVTCGTPPCPATVTPPGDVTASNQTDAPAFVDAAGGDFHQVPGSPTIEAGADDVANGTADIDGQQRMIGMTDIGADEIGRATSTSVSCAPGSVTTPGGTTCTATVTDPGAGPTTPTGFVAFSSSGGGSFAGGGCTLAETTPGEASCFTNYTSAQSGTDQVTAVSPRDLLHEGSQGAFSLAVSAPPSPPTPPPPSGSGTTMQAAPTGLRAAALKKCKKKRSAAARRKCRKRAQLLPV